jgi:ABC-2 type transport system ATP-binding protein
MAALLEVQHLTKHWKAGKLALDDVSFQVQAGEIVGLLGHNGAGKSTMMGCMLGMVRPDAGQVRIGGFSVETERAAALRQIGAIYEAASFYDYLTGWQNLRVLCSLSGYWDEAEAERVLRLVRLHDRAGAKTGTYSHGMRQRLALAQALLPQPRCLLLDEPTDGLDPEGIREFREFILRLRDEFGMTILLNSHLLGEVEQMCDRCVILREGKKVYEGVVPGRVEALQRFRLVSPDLHEGRVVCARLELKMDREGVVELPKERAGHEVVKALVEDGVRVESWMPHAQSLEELYHGLRRR